MNQIREPCQVVHKKLAHAAPSRCCTADTSALSEICSSRAAGQQKASKATLQNQQQQISPNRAAQQEQPAAAQTADETHKYLALRQR